MAPDLLRIIDANYNRYKEALRVIEDVFRFVKEDRQLSTKARQLRHRLSDAFKEARLLPRVISHRDSFKDIGRKTDDLELQRRNIQDVVYANTQRAKESIRVIEELFKIIDKKNVYKFKTIRYNLYSFEKAIHKKIYRALH